MSVMNDGTFKICVPPKSGESLTSFIHRMAHLNGCEAKDIWTAVSHSNDKSKSHIKFSRFDYDLRIFEREALAVLLGLTVEELNGMSSLKMYSKFFNDPFEDSEIAATMLRDVFNTNVRKICPLCVKENNVLKLIWQIKEIDICPIHEVRLKSECGHCSGKISYSDNILFDPTCSNQACAGSLLSEYEKVPKNEDQFSKQKQYYEDWEFLLFNDTELAQEQKGLSMEQSLAIKLLFIAQGQQKIYSRKDIGYLSKNIIKSLASFIKSNRIVKRVRVQDVLHVLRAVGLSIEKFALMKVSSEYLESILVKREILPSSECLTPWCRQHKKRHVKMQLSKERIESRNRQEKVRYSYFYTCTSCFMRYGYHPVTKAWGEIHGQIDLISTILRLASDGLTRSQVTAKLNKNLFYISEIFGYLAYRNLLPAQINQTYSNVQDKKSWRTIDYFRSVNIDWREYPEFRYKKLKQAFGWSLVTYSYYYADSDVQEYLINKPSTLKKPLKKYAKINELVDSGLDDLFDSELNISIEQVAATVNVSEATLRNHGQVQVITQQRERQLSNRLNMQERELRELFDHELIKRRELGVEFPFRDVYKTLNHRREYIGYRFPGLLNYIIRMINEYNQFLKQADETNKRLEIRNIISDTYNKYYKLNVSLVARRLGINYIHVAGYRQLKSMISEEIEDFHKKI
ncbi:TniQ family protein [Paenibacillus zanthoxyli]|uniref:TniQ family protein n=1 Tax=Paenibacillus zanthoxyli TaxID=369399 RepID=UPI00046FEE80|nr:TniQ family protein [Paenibacillus zanthoxyli]